MGGTLPNGLAFAANGDIVIANFGTDAIERMTRDGRSTTLATAIDGAPLGKTNFVLVDSRDRIWFTVTTRLEPWTRSVNEKTADGYVGLVDENGVRVVADGFVGTNEIRFDEQEEWLYVVESNARRISRVRVDDDGGELERQVYGPADIGGIPDGFAFDAAGNLWITLVNADRLIALTPEGDVLTLLDDGDPARVETWDAHFRAGTMTPEIPARAAGTAGTDDGERDLRRARPAHGIPRQPDGDDDPVLPFAGARAAAAALEGGRRPSVSQTRSQRESAAWTAVRRSRGRSWPCGVQDLLASPRESSGRSCGAVAAEPRLRHLGTRHEASAAWMAAATFHGTGRGGGLLRRDGPGAHNLVGGLGTAACERPRGARANLGTHPTQLGYAALRARHGSRRAGPDACDDEVDSRRPRPRQSPGSSARQCARRSPAGRAPCTSSSPPTSSARPAEIRDPALDEPVRRVARPASARRDVEERRGCCRSAERPLLVAGGGVVLAGATEELAPARERLGAARDLTQMGLGAVIPTDDPASSATAAGRRARA